MSPLFSLADNPWLWLLVPVIALAMTARYFLFAGTAYLVVHRYGARRWARRRIQSVVPGRAQIRREIGWSLSTFVIFGLLALATKYAADRGWTQVYWNISDYGWAWFAASVVLILALHDVYFYWMHRFMHWRPVYARVHAVHHRSTNPTPFAAFAFHPLEAVLEYGIVPLAAFLMPVHPLALLTFVTIMLAINVMGHLGFEFYPRGFARGPFRILNTATHHNMHHRTYRHNFGLYTNIWDRLCGTNHPRYVQAFEQAAGD